MREQVVATHNHTKRVSLYKTVPEVDRRAAPCLHDTKGRARAPTGRRQAHKCNAASCSAQSPGKRRPAFRMPLAQMQAAPRSKSPRSWRPRLQEQKVWSARGEAGVAARRGRLLEHGMASRLGPGRGRTPGWDVGPGEGRGIGVRIPPSLPRLPAPAGKGRRYEAGSRSYEALHIHMKPCTNREAALRKSTANRKKRSLFVGYIASGT